MALRASPVAAIHHPQEVRLDPTHPGVFERAAKVLMPGGEVPDLGPIRLVNDDRLVVIVGEDVPARLWPLPCLFGIAGRWNGERDDTDL